MRFRFCGDLEAPTWLLHEVPTLSEISSVRLKLLAKQVLQQLLRGSLDYGKALRFTTPKGAAPDAAVARGAVAAVHFVVASAVKYDVDDGVFATELEQLGLPRENAAAILRPYRESKGALRATFAAGTFRAAPTACAGWTADRAAGSAALRLSGPDLRVDVGADKLAVLLHELGQVKAMMDANQE